MVRYLVGAMLLALVALIGTAERTIAGHGCCQHCGTLDGCNKVCRLICEEKKVSVTCWASKKEEFCLPCASKPLCHHCDRVCDERPDQEGPCARGKKFVWTEWLPGGARIHTRAKLMKKVVTKTVPNYRWVVEDLCPPCEAKLRVTKVPAGTELPERPTVEAKFVSGAAESETTFAAGE